MVRRVFYHSATADGILKQMSEFCQGSLTKGGRLSTVDLLVLTSLDQFFCIENIINLSYKTSYLNDVVNCAEPSPLVSIPWFCLCSYLENIINLSYKTSYLNEEVNCTEPSPLS
jgi:hypothetical protein